MFELATHLSIGSSEDSHDEKESAQDLTTERVGSLRKIKLRGGGVRGGWKKVGFSPNWQTSRVHTSVKRRDSCSANRIMGELRPAKNRSPGETSAPSSAFCLARG